MEGFETIRVPRAYFEGLKDEGYTSKQRGGSRPGLCGLSVLHVTVIRGYDLPPCALAQWQGNGASSSTYTTKTFVDDAELDAWLNRWNIELGKCRRL